MTSIKLRTTSHAFDRLHEAVDKVRSTSTTVKVPVDDLRAILFDHSKLNEALAAPRGALQGRFKIEEPG